MLELLVFGNRFINLQQLCSIQPIQWNRKEYENLTAQTYGISVISLVSKKYGDIGKEFSEDEIIRSLSGNSTWFENQSKGAVQPNNQILSKKYFLWRDENGYIA